MAATAEAKRHRSPFLQGILPIHRSKLGPDIIAGVTLAALGIPEVMGYATIAQMPVITGLYTILIPIAIFALLGSSRHLVVGADSATAAILAAGLTGLAAPASADWVSLAGIVAIETAAILFLARLVRLGFLADFLSSSVLIGFLTGVGIQVAMGQVAGMLGVPGGQTGGTVEKFLETLTEIPDANGATVMVTVAILVVILGLKKVNPKIPGALIAVIGAMWASYAFDLAADGVAVLGKVPGGLPSFGIPSSGWNDWATVLPTAISIFFVILAQSAATSRAYAAKYEEQFDENVDLVGLSFANVSAGLTGTFVVNGSPTKTQMVDGAGGRSQISMLTTAVIVAIVLLFLTGPLAYMPKTVLSTIVFLIGIELIDIAGLRGIFRWRRDEFVVAMVTALMVVTVGVEQGIILAIILSIIIFVRRGYRPRDTVVTEKRDGALHFTPFDAAGAIPEIMPGLVVYRFPADLFYANAQHFSQAIRAILHKEGGPPTWLCLEASGIGDVDYSGGKMLLTLAGEIADAGVRFVIADVDPVVREELDRFGVTELVGQDAYYDIVVKVVDQYERKDGSPS